MRGVGGPVVQHHLGVTGQFDPPRPVAEVAEGYPPQFPIDVGRHAGFEASVDFFMTA